MKMKGKILIVYYSHSGNTAKMAELITKQIDGTLCELMPEKAYPNDYNSVLQQSKEEIASGFHPKLKNDFSQLESYGTVFIGTPNWCSTIAPPLATFLDNQDLAGKTVIPFCTHGGGSWGRMERDIADLCPDFRILKGLAVYGVNSSEERIIDWLKEIGIR